MRITKILLTFTFFLALLLAGGFLYLKHQMQRAQVDPEAIAAFYRQTAKRPDFAIAGRDPCANRDPLKKAWFGALHIHTNASFDATAFGVTNTASDAYAFSRGQALDYRLLSDPAGVQVPGIRLPRPLDFAAVTDHAGRLGERRICLDPRLPGHEGLVCSLYRGDLVLPLGDLVQPLVRLASQAIFGNTRSARTCGPNGEACREQAGLAWEENQRATEDWYDRSGNCEFTTFHGYEYTLAEDGSNLHRNVIFSSASVPPLVVSAKDMPEPEQLWQWLRDTCTRGGENCDVLTIPHNSNWSSGRMWFPYSYRDELDPAQKRAFASLRAEMEPLVEIMQVKGDSECRNGLPSVLGGVDELCDFEKLRAPQEAVEDCGEDFGSGNMRLVGCLSRFSYARYALSTGLAEQDALGVNPFKLGIIAATDNHNATPTAEMERGYLGANGPDRDARNRLRTAVEVPGGIARGSPVRYNPGGVAGVWAKENSRPALFAAMKRRETFGTSGPRIEPRFFAAWDMSPELCDSADMVLEAYTIGVPMGADLPPPPTDASSPSFLTNALQDPEGNLLQRLQIIKGWVDADGKTHQAVYDIAGDTEDRATVDPQSCEARGPGFSRLCSVWQDPDFDAGINAVYYARVVENPSCRWSTYDCNSLSVADRPASCSDPEVPKFIRERAWTSPIWYNRGRP